MLLSPQCLPAAGTPNALRSLRSPVQHNRRGRASSRELAGFPAVRCSPAATPPPRPTRPLLLGPPHQSLRPMVLRCRSISAQAPPCQRCMDNP
uniref:Uncharacterized protein n=1 Tax=Arundo donax TaxID=35708 RepID=A0A0A9DDD5_ARUDO